MTFGRRSVNRAHSPARRALFGFEATDDLTDEGARNASGFTIKSVLSTTTSNQPLGQVREHPHHSREPRRRVQLRRPRIRSSSASVARVRQAVVAFGVFVGERRGRRNGMGDLARPKTLSGVRRATVEFGEARGQWFNHIVGWSPAAHKPIHNVAPRHVKAPSRVGDRVPSRRRDCARRR